MRRKGNSRATIMRMHVGVRRGLLGSLTEAELRRVAHSLGIEDTTRTPVTEVLEAVFETQKNNKDFWDNLMDGEYYDTLDRNGVVPVNEVLNPNQAEREKVCDSITETTRGGKIVQPVYIAKVMTRPPAPDKVLRVTYTCSDEPRPPKVYRVEIIERK